MTDRHLIENPPPWPNGARCAVAFTFDMDGESLLHLYWPKTAPRHVAASSVLRYGPEIAVPRLLKMFRHFDLRQTFFVPGWCARHYPSTMQAIVEVGHEVGHHGWLHERPFHLDPKGERDVLQAGIRALVDTTGAAPRGYRAPSYGFSPDTLKLLLDAGCFTYDSSLLGDDIPYLLEDPEGQGSLLELPVDVGLEDWPLYMGYPEFGGWNAVAPPARAVETFKCEFEAAWRHGGLYAPVWHPFVSGRPSRVDAIWDLIEHMQAKGEVWFATLEEIASHIQGLIDDGSWTPRARPTPPVAQAEPILAEQDAERVKG